MWSSAGPNYNRQLHITQFDLIAIIIIKVYNSSYWGKNEETQTRVQQKNYDKTHDAKAEKPLKVINRFDRNELLKS